MNYESEIQEEIDKAKDNLKFAKEWFNCLLKHETEIGLKQFSANAVNGISHAMQNLFKAEFLLGKLKDGH